MKTRVFPRAKRVVKPSEFQKIYKGGRRASGAYFTWFYLVLDAAIPEKRLGITVTKSVGNAVQRNRIKRVVREYFRTNLEGLPSGLFVIKAKDGASKVENKELLKDLQNSKFASRKK